MSNHSYDDDYLWDTGNSRRLDAFHSSLPEAVTSAQTIVLEGRPRFKSSQTIPCPNCGAELRPGTTRLVFKYAPKERCEQEVEGLVCDCGEAYVRGDVGLVAFRRAMDSHNSIDGD